MPACSGTRPWIAWIVAAILLPLFHCSESLPPYLDPRAVLSAHLKGAYVLTISENAMKVYLDIKNIFDETFEAPAVFEGDGEIALIRKPGVRKTFSLTAANVVLAPGYNRPSGILRLDPGDSIRVAFTWNFIDDLGTDLRNAEFLYVGDTSCQYRRIAYGERFSIRASFRVFDKIDTISEGPIEFIMCHVNVYVLPNYCPIIDTESPCAFVR